MLNRAARADGYLPLTDAQHDALSITEWLKVAHFDPAPIVPASAVDGIRYAHENPEAWPLVTLPAEPALDWQTWSGIMAVVAMTQR